MPTVHLPGALSGHAAGQRRVEVAGATVGKVLAALGQAHPGVGQRVLDDRGVLRRHVNVFVNGESIRYLSGIADPGGRHRRGLDPPRRLRRLTAGPGDKGGGPSYGGPSLRTVTPSGEWRTAPWRSCC